MQTIRTRFAPSPTGYMHIGNLRTAVYEYLIAKANGGKFILRIEDTDQARLVDGSVDIIFNTLAIAGIKPDEGPRIGGDFGPYVQSERKGNYLQFAKELVEKGKAYYCFCTKERLETLVNEKSGDKEIFKYDRKCLHLSKEEIEENLKNNVSYVIRQIIPEGKTTFVDEVFGEITIDNDEMDDQILIKSDGMPTYNFANVIDDHLMEITHVIRGNEYLTSTPKYNLLYDAFGWAIPTYIHLPLVLNESGQKLSKRRGDASFEDLLEMGFLPEAIINYITLLGWSPETNEEFFTLEELEKVFSVKGLSKSPSVFDKQKLTWMNGEYFKKMDKEKFKELALNTLKSVVKKEGVNVSSLLEMAKTRISFVSDINNLFDFIDELPEYDNELYVHKKMKTTIEDSPDTLEKVIQALKDFSPWENEPLYNKLCEISQELNLKNGQVLWPVRTALSGKPTSPCGASELLELLGKEESLKRLKVGIDKLK